MTSETLYSIADMERETGIGRDTLRVWERRYGFPSPQRNQRDERVYSSEQLERLRLLKQIMDMGMQPGKLLKLDNSQLHQLKSCQINVPTASADVESMIQSLGSTIRPGIRHELKTRLEQYGLKRFLTEVVAPMNHAVGEAWFAGRIGILEEHRYAEVIRTILTNAISTLPAGCNSPKVLLTTFPGEQHCIGILMVACMLRLEGAEVLSIGVQTPLEEVVRGAVENSVDIVGISCSGFMTRRTIASQLVRLRKMLPEDILLWAGGSGINLIGTELSGISFFSDLNQIISAIRS